MTEKNERLPAPSVDMLDKAERLIWQLLDDNLPEEDADELQTMIKENDFVRKLYLECVQIHTELLGHFAKKPKIDIPELSKPPVLGSLGDSLPGVDTGPAVAE